MSLGGVRQPSGGAAGSAHGAGLAVGALLRREAVQLEAVVVDDDGVADWLGLLGLGWTLRWGWRRGWWWWRCCDRARTAGRRCAHRRRWRAHGHQAAHSGRRGLEVVLFRMLGLG